MYLRFSLLLTMLTLFACAAAPTHNSPATNDSKLKTIRASKVEPHMQQMADKLAVLTATAEFLPKRSLSSFSTPIIRVDDAGNIECYIYLRKLDETTLAELKPHVEMVETTNSKLAILQAWVPHLELDEIAQFDFVIKITPPDYAITQPALK